MLGETNPTGLADQSLRQLVTMTHFVTGILWLGLQPGPLLAWFAQPVSAILGSR